MNRNKEAILASVRWIPEAKGGRYIPPVGKIYGCNLRFLNDKTLVSIVICATTHPDNERNQKVELGFLFYENIKSRLDIGKKFLVFEGHTKLVAEGIILEKLGL